MTETSWGKFVFTTSNSLFSTLNIYIYNMYSIYIVYVYIACMYIIYINIEMYI